ncbi:hypothetical protein ISS06_02300 [Patescibacteria group bacterium]|nr:hypothetical protein [Patescibacteria group bacterium]
MRLNKIILIFLLAVLLMASFWNFNLKVLLADYYYHKVIATKDWEEILKNYDKVLFYQPFEPFYQKRFANDLKWGLDFYNNNSLKLKIVDMAIDRMLNISSSDRTFFIHISLARFYSLKANITQAQVDFVLAEKTLAELVTLSPEIALTYNDWCQLKIYQQEWEQAIIKCTKALELHPSLEHPQMNEQHRRMVKAEMINIYEKLGNIYLAQKKYQLAEDMYVKILKFFPLVKTNMWKKIGDIYYLQGDLDTAIIKNLHGQMLNPKDPVWIRALYLLYQEKNNQEMMDYWFDKIPLDSRQGLVN